MRGGASAVTVSDSKRSGEWPFTRFGRLLGDSVAAANSLPTFWGMPSVDLPWAAACMARNCAWDFAGILFPSHALQPWIGLLGFRRGAARTRGQNRPGAWHRVAALCGDLRLHRPESGMRLAGIGEVVDAAFP